MLYRVALVALLLVVVVFGGAVPAIADPCVEVDQFRHCV